jgi:hypothetical protein
MKKPWEETWTAKQETATDGYGDEHPVDWWVVETPRGCVSDCVSEEAAKLVSSAPEMARLLQSIHEVTAAKDRRGEPEIGGDFKIAVEFLLSIEDELAAVLRKAGVLLPGGDK